MPKLIGLRNVAHELRLSGSMGDRVTSVLSDTTPVVILTTSSVVDSVTEYARAKPGESAPQVIEVDLLGPNSGTGFDPKKIDYPTAAYLQYTSGSTRRPTGVTVSPRNLQANFGQVKGDVTSAISKSHGLSIADLVLVPRGSTRLDV
jgi:acyl-CoA synthetase (AMP-forming)/AMP-acid ligase II